MYSVSFILCITRLRKCLKKVILLKIANPVLMMAYLCLTYSQVHIYLDTGTIFIILAVDQNIFKLQLYNEYGLEVHTL